MKCIFKKKPQHKIDTWFPVPAFKKIVFTFLTSNKNASNQKLTRTHEACKSQSIMAQRFFRYLFSIHRQTITVINLSVSKIALF